MEIVLSIIAIVVSAVSLFFNAYPVYCKYLRKKEKTIITITDCKIDNETIIVKTSYIDSNGNNKSHNFNVGQLIKTDNDSIVAYVEHISHIMIGKKIIATVK